MVKKEQNKTGMNPGGPSLYRSTVCLNIRPINNAQSFSALSPQRVQANRVLYRQIKYFRVTIFTRKCNHKCI